MYWMPSLSSNRIVLLSDSFIYFYRLKKKLFFAVFFSFSFLTIAFVPYEWIAKVIWKIHKYIFFIFPFFVLLRIEIYMNLYRLRFAGLWWKLLLSLQKFMNFNNSLKVIKLKVIRFLNRMEEAKTLMTLKIDKM